MDIFKVLSRGIKAQPKKNQPGAPQLLPSAGAKVNPQFFHDNVGGSNAKRGKKRKRKGAQANNNNATESGDDDDDASDVDYFAPKPTPEELAAKKDAELKADEPKKQKPKLMEEDECRQILKSHRLKFTVLAGRATQPEEVAEQEKPSKKKKQKKDSKKEQEEEAHKKKKKDEDKKQLYPQPLNSFGELKYTYGIHPTLADNITKQGFRVPTEVQMGSLPLQLRPEMALEKATGVEDVKVERGIDFLGVAPTGSGKTISFLIPAIDAIIKRRADDYTPETDEHVLQAIVVAPTRELASQIVNEGRKLAIGTGVRVVLMKRTLRLVAEENKQEGETEQDGKKAEEDSDHDSEAESEPEEVVGSDEEESDEEDSDADKNEESKAKKGDKKSKKERPITKVDILVTTPKILLNFLCGGEKEKGKPRIIKKTLPSVQSLILDEADVLLDPIFRKQTMGIWHACTHPNLGMTCWSATMASNIEALITKHIEKRARRTPEETPKPLIRLVVGLKDTAVPNITHKLIYTATEPGKLLALRQLLHPVSSADSGPPLRPPFLVFTQTIERAQALHDELKYDIPLEAGGSARVAVLHSSLSDSVRSKIMARFRSGEVWVLITTDVLARGVDFAGVNGVVNYDVPVSAAAYVHRAGRTGRAGREGGVAVTFYTKDDIPFVKSVANVIAMSEKQAGKDIEEKDIGKAAQGSVQKWLLDALPKVAKEDKRKLKVRGVESRRTGGKATITTKSSWERRRENNRREAIEASKRRKREAQKAAKEGGAAPAAAEKEEEWTGLD
ncbi:P-loop containing nucleoside triphosphate hydrolase protein [Sordaria brevicollis]|uniref:ATP-dependent RNA helicase n=1 Tax=Sordaria brevicollis TaxID=83679 RepID=A0AAE0NUV7_SORBR|nr:P-loop containing nucleoside triphosphate hydrolase protein [Sordaria brevicollis]